MKKYLLTTAATIAMIGLSVAAHAEDVKIGVTLGYTGPIESLTPHMAQSAEAAIAEVNASGKFTLGTVTGVRGDTTCTDSAAATAMFERLVTSDGITATVGGDCSGITGAMLQNVARPKGVLMISPSATSPALTTAEDDGFFFRTSPSDARQGQIVAEILKERGFKSAAITYTNTDYGKGLADSVQGAWEAAGGEITIVAAHEDGKADYSSEVAALASAGGDILVVAGYLDQGGKGIIQASLDTGAFETFELSDGMIGDSLTDNFGTQIEGSFGQLSGTDSPGGVTFKKLAEKAGINSDSPYTSESYDAAALILLAMQAAKSSDAKVFKDKVTDVANAPGEKIFPGELAKALEILANGGEVDYVGASDVEFINGGESAGSYREVEVKGGKLETVGYR